MIINKIKNTYKKEVKDKLIMLTFNLKEMSFKNKNGLIGKIIDLRFIFQV